MTGTVRWYDRVAGLYDLATLGDRFYADMRGQAVAALGLSPGDTVVDLFCGTGADLPLLADALDGEGRIVAVDGSAEMLARAGARGRRLPEAIDLEPVRMDLSTWDGRLALGERIRATQPRAVLITLGLSVLENWREVFGAAFDAAPQGCRFAILDDYGTREDVGKRITDWLGAADVSRPVWQELEARAESFERRSRRLLPFSRVEVFVAAGTKPSAPISKRDHAPHGPQRGRAAIRSESVATFDGRL
jgi:SAM-dependent methyltransferase